MPGSGEGWREAGGDLRVSGSRGNNILKLTVVTVWDV